jgi:hypothetical protein
MYFLLQYNTYRIPSNPACPAFTYIQEQFMIRISLLSGLSIALSIVTSTAAAQSAHVHGEGRVNIAIDGNRIFMALEFPGADIVGFEHEARSSDEKAAVARAIAQLGDPMQLLRFEADADCELRTANAATEGEHEEHEGEEHEEHEDEEAHGTFVAEYEFECADIGALGFIEFTYFSLFNNAHSLDIVLIDGNGQRRAEIDRANPVLRLKE